MICLIRLRVRLSLVKHQYINKKAREEAAKVRLASHNAVVSKKLYIIYYLP